MSYPKFNCLPILFGFLLLALTAGADDVKENIKIPEPGNTQIITLDDGSSLVGRIIDIGDTHITFDCNLGQMSIAIEKIRKIAEVADSSFREGKYWFPNPNRTRLYFGSTGRMLKGGDGYISDTYIFFPGFAYGITDNITIGGGFSIFPGLSMNEQLFYLTPKIGIKASGSADFAIGAFILRVPGDAVSDDNDDGVTIGTLNVVGTFGSDDLSLTTGLGYGFAGDELADKPAVQLGGEWRFARRLSFVTENWILPEIDAPVISYGIRFFGESLTTNFALFNILDDEAVFPGIPYVDFVWNF